MPGVLVVTEERLCADFVRPLDGELSGLFCQNLTCLLLVVSLGLATTAIFLMTRWLCLPCLPLLFFICDSNDFSYL